MIAFRRLTLAIVVIVQSQSAARGQQAAPSAATQMPSLSQAEISDMVARQVRFNAFGDLVRNLAPASQSLASVFQGAASASADAAGGIAQEVAGKLYQNAAPSTPMDSLTQIARAYQNVINEGTQELSDEDQRVTNDRATYDDQSLCATKLLICSKNWFSSTRMCSNNVIDPSTAAGLRSINIVEVACDGFKARITRTWQPQTYSGPEIRYEKGETVFRGNTYSHYCTPCR